MPPRRVGSATKVKDQFQASVDFLEEQGPIWQERMGLSHIEIEHHYLDASSELLLGSRPKNRPGIIRCGAGAVPGSSTYTAFVETRWNYQMADVYYMLTSTVRWAPKQLKAILVHEYSHILTAPEQYLLEYKIEEIAAESEMTTSDLDTLASLYYERMEMATENVARAVLAGWERYDNEAS